MLGLFSVSPMLCTGCLLAVCIVSALVYLLSRPYADQLQNVLLGLADICSSCGLLFISAIYFLTQQTATAPIANTDEIEGYFKMKWVLGWLAIICILIGVFLLLAELLVGIVKGNSSPLKLPAEDPKEVPPLLYDPPKNI